ncbi:MAG TPA: hypothetical protein VFY63_07860 [Pseudorhizobium sp.]|nr:hypothetical protein [Pseudorhizobium sp.]
MLRVFFFGASVVAQEATLKHTMMIPSHFAEREGAPPQKLNFKPLAQPATACPVFQSLLRVGAADRGR